MTTMIAPTGLPSLTGGLPAPTEICATGFYAPNRVVSNDEIVRGLDTTAAWVEQRTGIRERRFMAEGEATSDMCVAAAQAAIDRARLTADSLDVIILATASFDQPLPSTALTVAEALGAYRAWVLDLNQAACAGGVYGMLVASHLLQNEAINHVLVLGADCFSRFTDPADRTTRVFFGDAAGAVIMRRSAPGFGLLSWDIGSAPSPAVRITAGGCVRPTTVETARNGEQFLRMDGKVVWEVATDRLTASITQAVKAAGLAVEDVAHVVVHQANLNIIHQVMDNLAVPQERAVTTIQDLGNTGAATVFTVLDRLSTRDLVRPGDIVVIAGIGAGFMWGTLCMRQR